MRRFAGLACGFGLVCLGTAAQAAEASYKCEDGTALTAVFAGGPSSPGSATLTFADGGVMKLPQAVSADGGRYVGGGTEFWIKGRGATLTQGGRATTCMTH